MSAYELKVRTAERPMAFTRAELWRGARNTWYVFMVLMNLGLVLMMVFAALFFGNGIFELPILLAFTLGYAIVFGGGISLIVMIAGAPIAGLVGKALQRESRILVHLLVYAALGLLIAVLAVIAVALLFGATAIQYLGQNPIILIVAGSATAAVPLGWWMTTRRALREDRGIIVRRRRAPRPDLDALAEDAL